MVRRVILGLGASIAAGVILLTSTAQAASPAVGPPPPDAAVQFEVRQLMPDLYVLIGAGGNTVVRKTPAGSVIVDTKYQGKNVYDALLRSIGEIKAAPVKYVLISHFHSDHTGNTGAFHAAGVPIVAQSNVSRLLPLGKPKASDVPAPAAPTITFDRVYNLEVGGARVQGFNYGPGHTAGDAVYYFPDLKVVTTGDLAVSVITPYVDYAGGGSILGLQHVLHEIAKLDFVLCIPGHRDQMMTKAQFLDFTRRWDLFADRARELVRSGVAKDQFFARLKSDDLGFDFKTFGWSEQVASIYEELSGPKR